MPELQIGAPQGRAKSKKLEEIPVPPQALGQPENPVLPAGNRRRGGAGRGRGRGRGRGSNAAAVAKAPTRQAVGGRGRGKTPIGLDTDHPFEALAQAAVGGAAVGGAQDFILNQETAGIAGKKLAMDGVSAEKVIGAEDETTTPPVPERVCLPFILGSKSKVGSSLC